MVAFTNNKEGSVQLNKYKNKIDFIVNLFKRSNLIDISKITFLCNNIGDNSYE